MRYDGFKVGGFEEALAFVANFGKHRDIGSHGYQLVAHGYFERLPEELRAVVDGGIRVTITAAAPIALLAKILDVFGNRVGGNFDGAPGAPVMADRFQMRLNLRVPLVAQFVMALESIEQFIDGDAMLLRADERRAAMQLGYELAELLLFEAFGLMKILLRGFEF